MLFFFFFPLSTDFSIERPELIGRRFEINHTSPFLILSDSRNLYGYLFAPVRQFASQRSSNPRNLKLFLQRVGRSENLSANNDYVDGEKAWKSALARSPLPESIAISHHPDHD